MGPWAFSEVTVLRALAAAAAATAVLGAVVMRRWDAQAGKQVAELTRARAGDEWRFEERVAELETDLEESRELRAKLEQRLRAKRAELAGLRNEHAALLRRYATAETERASALEGRRLLEIEAAVPEPEPAPSSSPALPPARSAEPAAAAGQEASGTEERPAVFSPGGAELYRRALTAMARFDSEGPGQGEAGVETDAETGAGKDAEGDEPGVAEVRGARLEPAESAAAAESTASAESADATGSADAGEAADSAGSVAVASQTSEPEAHSAPEDAAAEAAVAKGEPAADGVKEGAGPAPATELARPVGRPPAGHFTVPTAVAVVPAAPVRRPVVEGGFDFFGTQKGAPKATLDSVQNEDLADVVGPEALAVHKAESEAGFKAADARSRGVGQVIDLTAHDETEQIDIQGLRSAAS
ncbi:hypothetical protein C3492_39020 [Streptomyces sp. Ru62]|nr:hypothetical protein C3492_39020 [Streptomyces sp. Ru62]